jgi:two-component system response regulator FixJ
MPDGKTEDAPAVLLIDDDEAARLSIAQMLQLRGFKVEAFSSAEAALGSLEKAKCIITDIKMPGMDGEQLLAEATRRGVLAPILIITGHGDIPMAVRCLRLSNRWSSAWRVGNCAGASASFPPRRMVASA